MSQKTSKCPECGERELYVYFLAEIEGFLAPTEVEWPDSGHPVVTDSSIRESVDPSGPKMASLMCGNCGMKSAVKFDGVDFGYRGGRE